MQSTSPQYDRETSSTVRLARLRCTVHRLRWLLPAAVLLFAGCGGGGDKVVRVTGTVSNAGQPLEVRGRDVGIGMVQVEFQRLGDNGQPIGGPETVQADAAGAFVVPGPKGQGIPPGKYRIAVRQWDPFPQVDKLAGRFDPEHTPIVREIAAAGEVEIDLSKP